MGLTALLSLPTSVMAQVPERFPAIPQADVEHAIRNAYCIRNEIGVISRSLTNYSGWTAYGIQLCDEQMNKAGVVVAWFRPGDSTAMVTLPDGRVLPRPEEPGHPLSGQRGMWTLFAAPMNGGFAGCALARAQLRQDPYTPAFCQMLRN